MNLEGETAIVTGVGGTLGRSTAMRQAKSGAKVAAVDIDRETLQQLRESIVAFGYGAPAFAVDISNNNAAEAVFSRSSRRLNISTFWSKTWVPVGTGRRPLLTFSKLSIHRDDRLLSYAS